MWTAEGISAVAVMELHDALLLRRGVPRAAAMQCSGAWHWVATNHRFNALLWDEEDKARCTDAEPSVTALRKRRIDPLQLAARSRRHWLCSMRTATNGRQLRARCPGDLLNFHALRVGDA